MASDAAYEKMSGTKLRLVHPSSSVDSFNFMGATGALDVSLAKFGRF